MTPAFGGARLAGVLAMVALISGCLHVRAEYRGPRALVYLFKPLTVACLLVLALAVEPVSVRYQAAVAVGLACSLAGDVFLMLPGDRFLPGVASFLLAHLAYLVAFTAGVPLGAGLLPLVPYALLGGSMLAVLWRGLGTLRIPVTVYVLVIVAMAWRAAGRAETLATAGARLAAVGAALFVLSDALLALNRFRRPFRSAQAVIHATYYVAQLAIAWSVGVA